MNHKFTKSALSDKCGICNFRFIDHTTFAICSSCQKKGNVEVVNGALVCGSCSADEVLDVTRIPIADKVVESTEPITPLQELEKKLETKDGFSTSKEFFNAETVALADIKATIDADQSLTADEKVFKMVGIVRERYRKYKEILFEAMSVQVEVTSKQKAGDTFLTELAKTIRKEEREKFKLSDITYNPTEVPVSKARAPKMTVDEKLATNLAKVMKISIEQARMIIKNQIASAGIKCSCAETPGMCRIHNA